MVEDLEGTKAANAQAGTAAPLHLSSCWACSTRVQIPLQNGQPAATYKVACYAAQLHVSEASSCQTRLKICVISIKDIWPNNRSVVSVAL